MISDDKRQATIRNYKYRVFINSISRGVHEAHQAAVAGVLDCHHIPITIEDFALENTNNLELIKRKVAECQVYILILGPTYGAIPKGETKSYIHIEYEIAKNSKQKILVFPLNMDDIKYERKKLVPNHDSEELANTEKFWKFLEEIQSGNHFCRQWTLKNPEEIRRSVALALLELPNLPDLSCRMGRELDFQQKLVTLVEEKEFIRKKVTAISSFDKLSNRTSTNIDTKVCASEFLAQRYQARMIADSTKGIFFESGSSITFVVRVLPDSFWQKISLGNEDKPNKQISTNNVLVYLQLFLYKDVPCTLFPMGQPETTYGATFGSVGVLDARSPNYDGTPLNKRARDAIKELGESMSALNKENTSLIIASASGLQLSDNHKIEGKTDLEIPATAKSAFSNCFGPHVGSYNNKVFKRYLYETKIPIMLVVDRSKINCPIDIRKCHFIFDKELQWIEVIENHPFALCVGCATEEVDELETLIQNTMPKFEILKTLKTHKYSALIARNEVFKKEFPEEVEV